MQKYNKFTNMSVIELRQILNEYEVTKETKCNVKKLITVRKKQNKKFLESFKGNYIFKLGLCQMKREGKAEVYYKGQFRCYHYNFAVLLLTMLKIAKRLHYKKAKGVSNVR